MPQVTIEQAMQFAYQHHRAGRLHEAAKIYRDVLSHHADHSQAMHQLGVLALQTGRPEAAVELIGRSLTISANQAEAHSNLSAAFAELGRFDDAIASLKTAIDLQPLYADAHVNLGHAMKRAGRMNEAAIAFRRAIELAPDDAPTHVELGNALKLLGQHAEAASSYQQALRLRPQDVPTLCNLGVVLKALGELDDAADAYRRAIVLAPEFLEAQINLGTVLMQQRKLDQATQIFEEVLRQKPDYAGVHCNMGIALFHRGSFAESITASRRAIKLQSDYAEPHSNLALALSALRRPAEATSAFARAIAIDGNNPLLHWNFATHLLSIGDFARGWPESEWRLKVPQFALPRQVSGRLWNGEDVTGKTVLLLAEQGFGDMIQFVRYAPLIAARGARVIVECPSKLMTLMRTVHGVEQVISQDDPLPLFDFQCPMMSLPLKFGTTLEDLPAKVPYIGVDADAAAKWKQLVSETGVGKKVGLVWSGRTTHKNDRLRSMQLNTLAPLGNVPGVQFFNLQQGQGAEQLHAAPANLRLIDWTPELKNFGDAALIANLDLVITVDTATAHLAGALGRPVWVMLSYLADWRWLADREDSPWYPTMRLFRQSRFGDWSDVIDRIATELRASG